MKKHQYELTVSVHSEKNGQFLFELDGVFSVSTLIDEEVNYSEYQKRKIELANEMLKIATQTMKSPVNLRTVSVVKL